MPTGIATYALGRGASRVSYNAPQYAAVGEDRQLRPGTERAPRQSLVEVGRERVAAHLASSGPGAAGAGAAGAAGAAATLPLQPRNTMPTPRAVHKPRGVPGQHGGSRSTVTPGVMAAASAHDVFSRQTEQTLAHAGLMRQQRAAGNLSPAFTSATFRGGAVAAASEPSAGVGAAARVPGGVAPAAHVPRSTRPATAGQGGAVRSVSDSIATLTGERRVQALLSLSDHQIENDDGLTPFIAEIVDERERLKVRLMEQEDARQRAQEASLGAPATAEIFPLHQAPPASAASPTNADVVALNAMLCEGFPHVSKEVVSCLRGSSPRESFDDSFSPGRHHPRRCPLPHANSLGVVEAMARYHLRQAHQKPQRQPGCAAGRHRWVLVGNSPPVLLQVSEKRQRHTPTNM